MPQLFCQLASRPDPWLLGRTSAGLCTLQVACPLTITYSGGSPAVDTIAAGSAATVYGGSAATFDAAADVWVVLTVPGSGALQVTKEADLATVTGDWAGCARIVQHAVEPYQPQAYLAAGGLGTVAGTTSTVLASSPTPLTSGPAARALRLWNGSSNDAPPASWQTVGFNDSGWSTALSAHIVGAQAPVPGTSALWPLVTEPDSPVQALVRQRFTVPAGLITAAELLMRYDDTVHAVYLNGTALTLVDTTAGGDPQHSAQCAIAPGLLLPGGSNVLAVWVEDANLASPSPGDEISWVSYALTVTGPSTGGIPSPAGTPAEGDLLYYHSGAWTDLPIGTTGQELTVVGGDPAWTDQPTDTDTGGTVTSIAFAGPTGTSVSGSPISTSGTITLSWASQSANVVLAAPNGSSGAPTFRPLVGADIPVDASTIVSSAGAIKGNYQAGSGVSISGNTISATGSGGSVTSVALSMPSSVFSTAGSPVTTSGTLAVSLQTQASHTFWAGPASGSAATPTFRAIGGSDLPAAAGAGGHIHAHVHLH